jgi:hypothetical protein
MIMIKELQEKLDYWNNLRDELELSAIPSDLKHQMLSDTEYKIVCIDKLMQDNTISAMTITLIVFCAAVTGLFGYALTVKYLL